ncbi:MAG: hypothetical protein C7B46_19385 [Sulfobacillus benefaciens]|uniref:DUF4258 domain-containing protein n=1 Tax=Sulfobacillus benefaciens TaxID=453960 RepID=A0A2T2WZB3_9FIRM|nr:MAG: hypothetical protein C7B46_19385 [Sulfobacillus benefaciens]
MTIYSTRGTAPHWTLSDHGRARATQRDISFQEITDALQHSLARYPSPDNPHQRRMIVGANGVVVVCDRWWPHIITVYRSLRTRPRALGFSV